MQIKQPMPKIFTNSETDEGMVVLASGSMLDTCAGECESFDGMWLMMLFKSDIPQQGLLL